MSFVVFGHMCPTDDEWTPATRIVGLFAMPLFFFISGYFQSRIDGVSGLLLKFKKSTLCIFVPLISWGLIYVFLSVLMLFPVSDLFEAKTCIDIFAFLKYTPFYIAGFYWFLTALLLCHVVGSVLSIIIVRQKILGLLLLVLSFLLFCMISPSLFEHYHFSFVWFYYGMGMLYRNTSDSVSLKFNQQLQYGFMVFLTVAIICFGVNFLPKETFYYTSNLIKNTPYGFILWRYLLCLSASMVMLYWMKQYYEKFKGAHYVQLIASYGCDTLFIYCSHMLFLEFVHKTYLLHLLFHEQGSFFIRLEEHAIGIVITLLLYCLLQKLCLLCKRAYLFRAVFMGTN